MRAGNGKKMMHPEQQHLRYFKHQAVAEGEKLQFQQRAGRQFGFLHHESFVQPVGKTQAAEKHQGGEQLAAHSPVFGSIKICAIAGQHIVGKEVDQQENESKSR